MINLNLDGIKELNKKFLKYKKKIYSINNDFNSLNYKFFNHLGGII